MIFSTYGAIAFYIINWLALCQNATDEYYLANSVMVWELTYSQEFGV